MVRLARVVHVARIRSFDYKTLPRIATAFASHVVVVLNKMRMKPLAKMNVIDYTLHSNVALLDVHFLTRSHHLSLRRCYATNKYE